MNATAPPTEMYHVIQVRGGKFHRPNVTTHERGQWWRPMLTVCRATVTPLNVFPDEGEALDYCGGSTAHLCRRCFPGHK